MELIVVGLCAAFLLWRLLNAGAAATKPVPPEIPPENRLAFQVTWLSICFTVILFAAVLLMGVVGAGLSISYEQRGLCDDSIRVPNGIFGDVGQCTMLVLPEK